MTKNVWVFGAIIGAILLVIYFLKQSTGLVRAPQIPNTQPGTAGINTALAVLSAAPSAAASIDQTLGYFSSSSDYSSDDDSESY